MATAADHKIIIEKGADFLIEVQAYENTAVPKNMNPVFDRVGNPDGTLYTTEDISTVTGTDGDWCVVTSNNGLPLSVHKYETDSWVEKEYDTYMKRYTVQMVIKYVDDDNNIQILDTINGELVVDTKVNENGPDSWFNGNTRVIIDKSATSGYPTRLESTANPFNTEFKYFYTIDIDNEGNSDSIRLLRGKCAIRE